MINDRIQEIAIGLLLRLLQCFVSQQEAVTVLITLPADDSGIFANTIYRERRDRTAFRDQLYRYLGDIRVVGTTEIREEHNVPTQITHVVTHVVFKSYRIRIPSALTEVQRIECHKGIEVARVADDTYDHLVVIRRGVIAAAPEVHLVLANRIHIQLRHDGICAYITGGRRYIVI